MIKILSFVVTILVAVNASAIIYGADDRKELYESQSAAELGKSIATLMGISYVIPKTPVSDPIGDILFKFDLDIYSADHKYGIPLCKSEKFASQPTSWVNCTAFLVADDILATAGHCAMFSHGNGTGIKEDDPAEGFCNSFGFLFDFDVAVDGTTKTKNVSSENLYTCTRLIYAENLGEPWDLVLDLPVIPEGGQHGRDFALIKLDRKVVGRKPLKLATVEPKKGDRLMVIGYPAAMPSKYAMGSSIAEPFNNYFTSDLDILGGNSGSPVFNKDSEVVGLVVRGFPNEDYDYVDKDSCYTLRSCAVIGQGDCVPERPNEQLGTHAQKIAPVIERLKMLGL